MIETHSDPTRGFWGGVFFSDFFWSECMYQGYIWYSQVILCFEPKNWNFGSFWAFLSIFKPKFCIFKKFCQFSNGHHGLQFGHFDHPISRARSTELGQFYAKHFGRFGAHLGVKKSIFVNFLGKNCHFGNFPKAATGFNFGLLTIRFRVQLSWNLNFCAQEVSEALWHI